MKKLLLILLCIPIIGFGQNKGLWLSAGVSLENNLEGKRVSFDNYKNKVTPSVNLIYVNVLKNKLDINFKLGYYQNQVKTFIAEFTDVIGNSLGQYAVENNIHYVSLGSSLGLSFFRSTKFLLGPYFSYSFLNNSKYINNNNFNDFLGYNEAIVTEDVESRKIDFGIDFGYSYLLTKSIEMKATYKIGLIKLDNYCVELNSGEEYCTEDDFNTKSGILNFSLAYRL